MHNFLQETKHNYLLLPYQWVWYEKSFQELLYSDFGREAYTVLHTCIFVLNLF